MMMIWCELHSYQSFTDVYDVSVRLSSLVLNFHFVEYEEDIDALSQISQEELVQELRRHGRVQQNLKI
jgi:AP2-like factor, euAP2 lineage